MVGIKRIKRKREWRMTPKTWASNNFGPLCRTAKQEAHSHHNFVILRPTFRLCCREFSCERTT